MTVKELIARLQKMPPDAEVDVDVKAADGTYLSAPISEVVDEGILESGPVVTILGQEPPE